MSLLKQQRLATLDKVACGLHVNNLRI